MPVWQLNTVLWIQRELVLDPEERRLWRRFERGLRVVQVWDATRPLVSGEYYDWDGCQALVKHLREVYGVAFNTAKTAKSVEDRLEQIMANAGIPAETMHYGKEMSRNDLANQRVGLVIACIDPDDYTVDLLAELDLDAELERFDPDDCENPENAEFNEFDGAGCFECNGTGLKQAQGRGFTGEDAEAAAAILASGRTTPRRPAAATPGPDDPESTRVGGQVLPLSGRGVRGGVDGRAVPLWGRVARPRRDDYHPPAWHHQAENVVVDADGRGVQRRLGDSGKTTGTGRRADRP